MKKDTVKDNKISILVVCADFSEISGSPIYNYNLFKHLTDRANITIAAPRVSDFLKNKSSEHGIVVTQYSSLVYNKNNYDLLVLNQPYSRRALNDFPGVPAMNIVHSPRVLDEPVPNSDRILKYFYAKEIDKDYIMGKVPSNKIMYLPIPIDMSRLKDITRNTNTNTLVSISTIDKFRQPMFLSLFHRSITENRPVKIVGKDFGGLRGLSLPPKVSVVYGDTWDIGKYLQEADEVAGIYEGTINLEAMAVGRKCSLYQPDGSYSVVEPRDVTNHYSEKVSEVFWNEVKRGDIVRV